MIKKIETVWVTGQFQALAPWEPGQEAEFHSISFLTRIVHQWYSLSLLCLCLSVSDTHTQQLEAL